jgi:uncharacterized surface protein with fasciclin (FAS1) repeats
MIKSVTKPFMLTLTLLAGVIMFAACDNNSSPAPDNNTTIAETVQSQSNLSSLSDMLSDHGLIDTLSQDGPLTLFAPDNDAWSQVDSLLSDIPDSTVKRGLEYHIVAMNLTYDDLKGLDKVKTLSGDTLYFSTKGDSVIINDGQAVITSEGTEASNGTVFVVDSLLSPLAK